MGVDLFVNVSQITKTPRLLSMTGQEIFLKNFERWDWRIMEKISWTDRVRNEVLRRFREETNFLRTLKRRKANCIGYISHRNCHLKHVI